MADERDQIAQAMLATQLERNPALPPEAWNRGVQNVMGGLAAIPSRMMGAAQQYTDTGQYNPAPFVEGAGMLMGGGMPMAAKSAAGIYGGRLSQTADLPQLMRAEDMALNRKTAPAIWKETGWVQRPDKGWRYAIPDKDASIDQLRLNTMRHEDRAPLGEVLRHPAAYEAYPSLKNIQFGHSAEMDKKTLGYFAPERRQQSRLHPNEFKTLPQEIVVNARQDTPMKRSVVLHEMQHGVQGKEGFAIGGSPPERISFDSPAFKVFKELRTQMVPEKLEKLSPEQFTKQLHGNVEGVYTKEAIDQFINQLRSNPQARDRAAEHFAKQQAYNRLLGESEARLVQKQAGMSAEELRATFPSLDVPNRKLITRMADFEPW